MTLPSRSRRSTQSRTGGPRARSTGPVSAIAPLAAQRSHGRVLHWAQGNVSRFSDILSADALLDELHSDLSRPSAAGPCWSHLQRRAARAPARRPSSAVTSLPFVVVGRRQRRAGRARWLGAVRRRRGRGRPGAGAHRGRTSRRTRSPATTLALAAPRPGPSTSVTTAWSPSRPPTRSCSRDRSSRPGGPAAPSRDRARRRAPGAGRARRRHPVVTLTRPRRLNALDARMRDELVEALTLAAADPGITGSSCAARAGLLRRRRPRRVRHPVGPGHGPPHPARAERRPAAWPASQADDCLYPRRHIRLGHRARRVHRPGRGRGRHADRAARDRPRPGARRGRHGQPAAAHRPPAHGLARLLGRTIDAATALEWGLVDERRGLNRPRSADRIELVSLPVGALGAPRRRRSPGRPARRPPTFSREGVPVLDRSRR